MYLQISIIVISALLCSQRAHGESCIDTQLGSALDMEPALRDYESLAEYTRAVEDHADESFLSPGDPLQFTASSVLRTSLRSGSACGGPRPDGDANTGLILSVGDSKSSRKLTLMGSARQTSASVESAASDEGARFAAYTGLVGANLQVNKWLAFGAARTFSTATLEHVSPANGELSKAADGSAGYLFELGIPMYSLVVRLPYGRSSQIVPDMGVRDLSLSKSTRASLLLRKVATENRRVLIPEVEIAVGASAGMELYLDVDAGLESTPTSLRHLRVKLRNLLLQTKVSRESYNKIGARVEQYAALSLHRGNRMRTASAVRVAAGGEYRLLLGMQTPYIYFFMDFGVSFNKPEMLDIFPAAANQGQLNVGTNLARRW